MNPIILDDISAIKALDTQNMLASLELLPEQMRAIAHEAETLRLSARHKKARHIVVCGMGGSTLASHVIKALYSDVLPVPLEIINGYDLPRYVGKDTAVMVTSYSGTTEEAIACFKDAVKRRAEVFVLTSGGELQKLARKNGVPSLIFSTDNNPCHSPRMGLGYSLVGQLAFFSALGFIPWRLSEVKNMFMAARHAQERYGVHKNTAANPAKEAALKMAGRSIWWVAAEHLAGSAHIGANQTNENAKRFAGYFIIPELNHHLMEGITHPISNRDHALFILLESGAYDKRIIKRFAVTKDVLEKNSISHISLIASEKKLIHQIVETLVFTSYASFYAALAQGIDPTAIPYVDFFKEQLKK